MKAEQTTFFGENAEEASRDSNKAVEPQLALLRAVSSGGKATQDSDAKWILRHRGVLAKILQYAVPEFHGLRAEEIREMIAPDSIKIGEIPVDSDFAHLNAADLVRLHEKPITFDVFLRDTKYNLMIDIEPQNKYSPGYSLLKRGQYYLSRMLSSQLSPTEATDYNSLRKCYSIWLCFDILSNYDSELAGEYHFKTVCTQHPKDVNVTSMCSQADLMELIILRAGGKNKTTESLLWLITALFRDSSRVDDYLRYDPEAVNIEREATSMCSMYDVGVNNGRAEGKLKKAISTVKRALAKGMQLEDALDLVDIDRATYEEYKDSFNENDK